MTSQNTWIPGITLRSFFASIFCMLVMAIAIQYSCVHLVMAEWSDIGLPGWAMVVFLALVLVSFLCFFAFKFRLLTKQELLCVLFSMLISSCLMTQGMWQRLIYLIATIPRDGNFLIIDAYNDNFWPHGENLLQNGLNPNNKSQLFLKGNVSWKKTEYEQNKIAEIPVLINEKLNDVSSITFTVWVEKNGRELIVRGAPYLLSFLARASEMGDGSYYFCRLYNDDDTVYNQIVTGGTTEASRNRITHIHRTGFVRSGIYGVKVSNDISKYLRIELGLKGKGVLELSDPKFFCVNDLETIFTGRKSVSESEYKKLDPKHRAGLIVKPDNMLSFRGLAYIFSGCIPLSSWKNPALAWFGFVTLLLLACYAINVIMRKQWAEHERFQFPMVKIPIAILGGEHSDEGQNQLWRNKFMWLGFGIALVWCLLKGWGYYNSNVPDVSVEFSLNSFLTDPRWGSPTSMWGFQYYLGAMMLALCVFMELNVLLSLALGLLLFRSLYWIGEFSGMKVLVDYPFGPQQQIGSFIGYGLITLFFSRKYLWYVLKAAFKPNKASSEEEMFSYRCAIATILGSCAGILLWAKWLDISVSGIFAFFAFLVLVGFVSSKLRAECGLPFGYFAPYNAMLFVSALGGLTFFGAPGVMTCLLLSGFVTGSVFYFIPGAQLELMEWGRRLSIKPRHILYTSVLGIAGGLFIGGWVFLSNAYTQGGDNLPYRWAFEIKSWYFFEFEKDLATAAAKLTHSAEEQTSKGSMLWQKPSALGYVFGFAGVLLISILRRLFAGFWFHPIGFIMGPSLMLNGAFTGRYSIWGCCITAWLIRMVVLKFGGAQTVQTKLLPFFVGVFLAALVSFVFFFAIAAYLHSTGIDVFFRDLL